MENLKKLFNALNLYIEKDKTVTNIENGLKSTVKCNNKPIISDSSAIEHFKLNNGNEFVLFNIHSKGRDCSYLVLEHYIHKVLSSKINFIISQILKFCQSPELYHQVKSEKLNQLLIKLINYDFINFDSTNKNTLLNKWNKINEQLSNNSFQNKLISLTFKIDKVCINDETKINYYKQALKLSDDTRIFAFFTSYTSVEFPLYNLLKQVKNVLCGVNIEKNELEIIKNIYQFIFTDIDKKNMYSLLTNKLLLKDKLNNKIERFCIVPQTEFASTPSMQLIATFNSLSTHIDLILDDLIDIDKSLVEKEKINLNLTKCELDQLESYNKFSSTKDYNSSHDFEKEIKLKPRINLEELNRQLNEVLQKPTKQEKRSSYKNTSTRSIPIYASGAILGINKIQNYVDILDPTDNISYESKIPNLERKRHTYILAGSGSGKTSLLETFLYSDIQRINQSIIIFDLMGKATNSVLKFVKDSSRLLIINPHFHSSITPIINPFQLENKNDELAIENRTKAIINAFDIALNLKDGWSVNMKAVLAPSIATLLRKGDSDIYELQKMMNDELNKDLVELGKKSPIKGHRNFFLQEFYNESYEITKRAISAKLQVFLNDPTFANLVTGKSTINITKEVNTKGKIIVIKLSSKHMLFARLMMELIQDIMRERTNIPEEEIVPTHIYLDEFQNYLTPTIEEILSESRNYKFYVTFAHQSFMQLNKKMQGIVLSNSHIKIVGQCSYDNGKKMAKEMKADFETIENLQQAEFVFKIGAKPVLTLKNTDKFVNDKTPYHNKQRTRHIKHQYKNYYINKESLPVQDESILREDDLKPKHKDF